MQLTSALNAWGSPQFADILKQELQAMPVEALPLQQGLERTSHVLDAPRSVMVIASNDSGDAICATVGVFYSGILAGCSCADDPTPVEPVPEYCEMRIEIDKATGEATAALVG